MATRELGMTTRCVHAGEAPDPSTGAHGVPLYASVTYAFRSFEQLEGMRAGAVPHFTYAPRGNPTVRCLELKLANLERTEASVAGASGMSVISATLQSLCANGGHVVAADNIYELTQTYLNEELPALGGSVSFVDANEPRAVESAIRQETRLVYAEPFSNPLLTVTDLRRLADVAHARSLPLVVDNTFLSPAVLRPAEHGADLVLHSATKYLSGHGQVQGGFASGSRALVEPIRERLVRGGGAMPPFSAWTLLAGVKTLTLRMRQHSANALALGRLFAAHPAVAEVRYPGLESHPGHATAVALTGGPCGGMLSLTLRGGQAAKAAFVDALELPLLAVSLGDVSTLVWPWATGDLIRVSVGIEDEADLLADFGQALDAAHAAG